MVHLSIAMFVTGPADLDDTRGMRYIVPSGSDIAMEAMAQSKVREFSDEKL